MHSKLQQFSLFVTLFLLLVCFNNKSLSAQTLKIPYLISIEGDIEMVSFFKNPAGDTLVAGNYKGLWKDKNKVWSSEGENDIFLGKWNEGLFNLMLSFGGSRNDILFDAKCLANGDIILAGSFTESMQLGQRILTTGENSKAIFLTKINEKGEVLWVALFQGSSWKEWGKMQLDEAKDEIILCGNFHDKIVADDGQTFLGIGESSVFTGILNLSSGKVKKMRAFSGSIASNQLYAISIHVRDNSILIAGNFDRDIMVDSLKEIALTKLDVLDKLEKIKICVGYKIDGEVYEYLPQANHLWSKIEPVYEEIEGWREVTVGAKSVSELPQKARNYIARIEELCGVKSVIISTGPKREETIILKDLS
jgi:hypothetical protein